MGYLHSWQLYKDQISSCDQKGKVEQLEMLTVLPGSLPPKRLSFFLLTSQHRAGADAVEPMCRRRPRKRVDSAQGRPAH